MSPWSRLPPARRVREQHPRPLARSLLWLWLALMALGLLLCAQARYVADMSAFSPAAPTAGQRVLLAQLTNGATARVLMMGIEGGTAAQRAQASRALAADLRASGAFESVHNGEEGVDEALGQTLFAHRYLLSPAVDPQRFSVDGLRDAIADTVSLLGTPAGQRFKPLLWRDPTGETLRMAEAMLPAQAPRVAQGVWVSRQAPRAVLLASTRADGADLDAQAQAQALVRQRFAAVAAPGLTLRLSGPGVFAVQSRATIRGEVERLATAGAVAMVLLLLIAFGSLRPLALAVLPVASGVVAGIVGVGLVAGQVHGLTLGFGTTLIGEAVDYGIYYLVQARGLGAQGWRRAHWPTVRLGVWTSLAGFAALVFSGFPGLAQLGVFTLCGLCAAALTTRYLLPRLAPQGTPGLGLRARLGRATGRAAEGLQALRWPLLALTLAAMVLLAWQASPWRGTLAGLSPVPPAALALDAALREDLGASDAGLLVAVQAADPAAALAAAERAGKRLDRLVDEGVLRGYQSPARLLPSPATQLARRAALPDAGTLRERLAQATAGGPLPAARLGGFIDDVQAQREGAPLTRAALQGTPLASAIDAQLAPASDGQGWTALLSLQPSPGGVSADRLRQAVAGLPGTRVLQVQPELDALYAHFLRQARWQALAGALAVVLLLALHLRSARRLARVLLPLVASVALVLCGWTLAGAALGVLHLIGLLLVVAIGSNYALFFDHLREQPAAQADEDTLASLLLANLTTVVSFGLLATAQVPALAAVGQTVAPGALLALLLSAAFRGRGARPAPVGQSPARG